MWETLSEPWRECVDLAWEAYRAGSLPIGAVVTNESGHVVVRGRNRIHERTGESGTLFGHKLAHAEVNALAGLDYDRYEPAECVLYATTEPCPLCVGALRISGVGELRFAAREPWGGSVTMFETVPYLRRGNVRVAGPDDRRLEQVLAAIKIERFMRLRPKILEQFLQLYEDTIPEATRAGKRIHHSGILQDLSEKRASTPDMLRAVSAEVGFST